MGVTHGGTIGMILEMLYDDKKKFYEWQPKNGEGYELTITAYEGVNFKIDNVIEKGGLYDWVNNRLHFRHNNWRPQ